LPNALRHVAAQWKTVGPQCCELCNQPEGADQPPSYIIIEGDPGALEKLLAELYDRNYLNSEFEVRHIVPW